MKVAIFIQDGDTQLVLTPEGEWEQGVVDKMASDGEKRLQVRRGSFYECRGGYHRFGWAYQDGFGGTVDDKSLILRVEDVPVRPVEAAQTSDPQPPPSPAHE